MRDRWRTTTLFDVSLGIVRLPLDFAEGSRSPDKHAAMHCLGRMLESSHCMSGTLAAARTQDSTRVCAQAHTGGDALRALTVGVGVVGLPGCAACRVLRSCWRGPALLALPTAWTWTACEGGESAVSYMLACACANGRR